MNTLFPFLSIQARSLGISSDELGIIYSFLPVLGVFAPAVAGIIADTIGNFKIFLAIMVSFSGLASLLFLTIPVGRIIHDIPEQLPLTMNCSRYHTSLEVNSPLKCDFNNVTKVELNIKKCKYFCDEVGDDVIAFETLNKTWCSVTENCNKGSKQRLNESSEDGNFLTVEVELREKVNATLELQMLTSPFYPGFWEDNGHSYYTGNFSNYNLNSTECWLRCDALSYSKTLCQNSQTIEEFSPGKTMLTYTIVRLLNSFTLTCSIPLFEGAAIAILKEHDGDFGYQRMYANLGMVVMTPISGVLIDIASSSSGRVDFRPAFYMYCGLKFLCAFVICFMSLEFKKPSDTVLKDVKSIIVQPRVISFLAFTLVSGTCFGFIDTFLFWFLEDMKADKSLMGLAVTAGAVFGIPLLVLSTYIIKRLGHVGTLCVSMAIFTIRNLGYSFIQNPWLAMPFEAMEAFTNSLMGVVSVSYAAVLSVPSTVASLQGIYGGTYHGVGKGAGSLIGGFLIKNIGVRVTFQILALVAAITSVAYFALNWFVFRKNDLSRTRDENNTVDNFGESNVTTLEKKEENFKESVNTTKEHNEEPIGRNHNLTTNENEETDHK